MCLLHTGCTNCKLLCSRSRWYAYIVPRPHSTWKVEICIPEHKCTRWTYKVVFHIFSSFFFFYYCLFTIPKLKFSLLLVLITYMTWPQLFCSKLASISTFLGSLCSPHSFYLERFVCKWICFLPTVHACLALCLYTLENHFRMYDLKAWARLLSHTYIGHRDGWDGYGECVL